MQDDKYLKEEMQKVHNFLESNVQTLKAKKEQMVLDFEHEIQAKQNICNITFSVVSSFVVRILTRKWDRRTQTEKSKWFG